MLLDCSVSNASGQMDSTGSCLELTPAMCGEIVSGMCKGCETDSGSGIFSCPR